jgi:hypothetical protein
MPEKYKERGSMFRRTIALFTCFFTLTCLVAYWDHVRIRPQDRISYDAFVRENSAQRPRHALETHPATQKREQVQKDFWIPQGRQRQHLRILSRQSELILHERKGKLEAVEKLIGLECWLQEMIGEGASILHKQPAGSPAMQQVRHLTADEGTYFYPSHHFLAQTVHLQFYRVLGTDLPENLDGSLAFLSGTATEASFSACGRGATFTARHLHASFDPTRGSP